MWLFWTRLELKKKRSISCKKEVVGTSLAFYKYLSCCSAVSESDVGDQLVLLSSLAQLQNLDS